MLVESVSLYAACLPDLGPAERCACEKVYQAGLLTGAVVPNHMFLLRADDDLHFVFYWQAHLTSISPALVRTRGKMLDRRRGLCVDQ